MKLYLDLETNLKHDTIWCAAYAVDDQPPQVTRDPQEVRGLVEQASQVVNHNIVGFDAPVLEKVWGIKVPFKKMRDTLVISRLLDPSIDGGHSLDAWGKRLGIPKGDFRDYDAGYSEEMAEYAKQDIVVNRALAAELDAKTLLLDFKEEAVELEHQVAYIIRRQESQGVFFDYLGALELQATVLGRMEVIEQELRSVFPPIITERISEKTGKRLKDDVEVFNIGSRQQIAKRLETLGAKFPEETPGGSPKVDEKVLAGIDLPEAKMIAEYLTLQKRQGLLAGWIGSCTSAGRIHGRVLTNGAVTGRMTHLKPNMAQVPSSGSYLGTECRALFIPPPGKVFIGIDASALELCMLAHYMQDKDFTASVVSGVKEDGTDVHTRNMVAAKLETRDQAKTFIYAFLYGAGPGKIGQIVGGGPKEGQKLISSFLESLPSLQRLKTTVEKLTTSQGMLRSLDGRKLHIRSAHAALNTLLQGAGAVAMKKALVIFYNKILTAKLDAKFVLNVHDEWQLEAAPEHAQEVCRLGLEAIKEAGEVLGLRCPLSGEAKVGKSWAETH